MLEIQNLHVKFHNRDREAVSGVSLTIQDGEILGLVRGAAHQGCDHRSGSGQEHFL